MKIHEPTKTEQSATQGEKERVHKTQIHHFSKICAENMHKVRCADSDCVLSLDRSSSGIRQERTLDGGMRGKKQKTPLISSFEIETPPPKTPSFQN